MASTPTRKSFDPKRMMSTCETGKATHATREDALDAAEHQMDQGRVDPGCHLTPYVCDTCEKWHVRNRRIVFLDPPNLAKGRLGRGNI